VKQNGRGLLKFPGIYSRNRTSFKLTLYNILRIKNDAYTRDFRLMKILCTDNRTEDEHLNGNKRPFSGDSIKIRRYTNIKLNVTLGVEISPKMGRPDLLRSGIYPASEIVLFTEQYELFREKCSGNEMFPFCFCSFK